jgi:hypothetical protein
MDIMEEDQILKLIAELEAADEGRRAAWLLKADRQLAEYDDELQPVIRRIVAHFKKPAPEPAAEASSGDYDARGYDKYGSHWSHSEEAKADNREAFADQQRVAMINVHKHGTPTHQKGERIGLGYREGPALDPYILPSPLTDRLTHSEAEVPPLPMDRACR